jgi:20S proteasome alpha/beta subunit
MSNILDVFESEGLVITDDVKSYLAEREKKITAIRRLADQFSEGKTKEDIAEKIGTALGGIIGLGGKAAILAADGQTTLGYQRYKLDDEKIYQIDRYTAVAGTGTVAFIQDIVKFFELEVYFIQASKSEGTFVSPNGKANILANLVKNIIVLPLYFGIGVGFLLAVYDPKDDESRLFDVSPFGSISEKNILANGSGWREVDAILEDRYEELGGRDMNRKNLKWLAKRAINMAIKKNVFCGGEKLLYMIDKYGARRAR